MAEWLYTRALVTFREQGAGKTSEKALREALAQNPHVPPYLTGQKRIPNQLPPYMGWGDEREAKHYAASYLAQWRRTPGAVEWLKDHLKPSTGSGSRPKRSKRSKRKKGK
jgi:hypothetical protein